MKIQNSPISSYAMCRECAKEFGSKGYSFRKMHIQISKHVRDNPGHTVIGTEQVRTIYKDVPCITL